MVQQDGVYTRLEDVVDDVFIQHGFTFYDDFGTLDGYNFTSVFVYEVFYPSTHDATSYFSTSYFLESLAIDFNFFCEVEKKENVFVVGITNGAQQCGNR